MENFFVIGPIGWENDLVSEITMHWPYLIQLDGRPNSEPLPEFKILKGGVEFKTPLELGLQLNFFLRTATRVLWRVGKFKAITFPELEMQLKKINFPGWSGKDPFEVKVSAQNSQLGQEKRIAETAQRAWSGVKTEHEQKVFLRIDKNIVTVSVDTTGEPLYKRGLKTNISDAPIRETIAHWMLQQLIAETPAHELKNIYLMDPMCGSGTFILEARDYGLPVFSRSFAFQNWKKTPALLKSPSLAANYKAPEIQWSKLYAFDQDVTVIQAARKNFQQNRGYKDQSLKAKDQSIESEARSLKNSQKLTADRLWMISNPPYDLRVERDFTWSEYFKTILSVYRPEKGALIVPSAQVRDIRQSLSDYREWKIHMEIPVKNGGLDAVLLGFCLHQASSN